MTEIVFVGSDKHVMATDRAKMSMDANFISLANVSDHPERSDRVKPVVLPSLTGSYFIEIILNMRA